MFISHCGGFNIGLKILWSSYIQKMVFTFSPLECGLDLEHGRGKTVAQPWRKLADHFKWLGLTSAVVLSHTPQYNSMKRAFHLCEIFPHILNPSLNHEEKFKLKIRAIAQNTWLVLLKHVEVMKDKVRPRHHTYRYSVKRWWPNAIWYPGLYLGAKKKLSRKNWQNLKKKSVVYCIVPMLFA